MSENTAATEQTAMPKHGEFCWTEIVVNDIEDCKNFYPNVFGWELKQSKATGEEMEYLEYSVPGSYPMGGLFQMTKEMYGEEMPPPHFMNYIAVDDVDATSSKAFDLGGTIVVPPTDIPNIGRFAVIKDPTGAIFSVLTINGGGM